MYLCVYFQNIIHLFTYLLLLLLFNHLIIFIVCNSFNHQFNITGKSPLIVFDDAEISGAVDWIITGILWGSGQVCSATSRVLIHESIKQKVRGGTNKQTTII